jgi:hypothetical protein
LSQCAAGVPQEAQKRPSPTIAAPQDEQNAGFETGALAVVRAGEAPAAATLSGPDWA